MQTPQLLALGLLLAAYPNTGLHAQATKPPAVSPKATLSSPIGSMGMSSAFLARVKSVWDRSGKISGLVETGDKLLKNGDWQNAQVYYQQALDEAPKQHQALYGMAECSRMAGDTAQELDYSRQAIYHDGSIVNGFYENNTGRLMQFALLLNKAGQAAEAVSVYNHAAYALDYQDSESNGGKPHLKVLLPELVVAGPVAAQVQYTAERLQALADTVLAHAELGFGSNKEAVAHMQEAVKLYPDTPVTHYYLGEVLLRAGASSRDAAKAAYAKAAQLGDEQTRAAANERLRICR